MNLRSESRIALATIKPTAKKDAGELTFDYFYADFFDIFYSNINFSTTPFKQFKENFLSNIDYLCNKFIVSKYFSKFNVKFTYNKNFRK